MSTPHCPVTEFAFLHLIPPTTLHSPQLISGFLEGIKAQPAWSGYPLHLFIHQSPSDESSASEKSPSGTTSIYIISGWASAEAHNEWITSPQNQEIMGSFGEAHLLSLGGLAHLDIDFTKLAFEECSQIAWRKRGTNDAVSWDDISSLVKGQPGAEGRQEARVIWSYRGQAVDRDVHDKYELVGFSDGTLPEMSKGYTVLQKWNIEA